MCRLSALLVLAGLVASVAAQPTPPRDFFLAEPNDVAVDGPGIGLNAASILRQRLARLDHDILTPARLNAARAATQPTVLRLNLFDDVVPRAVVDSTGPTTARSRAIAANEGPPFTAAASRRGPGRLRRCSNNRGPSGHSTRRRCSVSLLPRVTKSWGCPSASTEVMEPYRHTQSSLTSSLVSPKTSRPDRPDGNCRRYVTRPYADVQTTGHRRNSARLPSVVHWLWSPLRLQVFA